MEMPSHCTVSGRPWHTDLFRLILLTLTVLLVHGFHPWAEDGGLYVAGIELLLHPAFFPLDRAFVTTPLHYSLFAPAVTSLVRLTRLPLSDALFSLYLLTTLLLLFAALRLGRCCFPGQPQAQWAGVVLLAAWWTLPVAGTSLLLMDPYLTARSFSTPLTLLAIGEVLQLGQGAMGSESRHNVRQLRAPRVPLPVFRCLTLLGAAAAMQPLMAIHATLFTLVLALVIKRAPTWSFVLLATGCLAVVAALQVAAPGEPPAVQAAVQSRDYWFLANWRWFEWLGLLGPLAVLFGITPGARGNPAPPANSPARTMLALYRSSLFVGLLAIAIAALLVREHLRAHTAARLQPLRSFLPIYALLPILLGGRLISLWSQWSQRAQGARKLQTRLQAALPWTVIFLSAAVMFAAQRTTFPNSPHIEWPGRPNSNPWVEAFVWIREQTPPNALFALDARYINIPGEDAQNFRALAHRSTLPDFSKDGGEAANFPALAPAWLHGTTATANLGQPSTLRKLSEARPEPAEARREIHLRGSPVSWLVLQSTALTVLPCPYRNQTVKVCHF